LVEIELSFIRSFPNDEQTLTAMVAEFGAQQHVKVHLRKMEWGTVWPELLTIASHGSGPDVSHIGGTWVSSLAKMNALRPFKADEIAGMGGAAAFMKPVWDSTGLFEDERIWSIPWTGWIYLICYRKDLLEKIGVDGSQAFSTIQELDKTIERLKNSALDIPWLNPFVQAPYTDLLHIAASWVWAAGGDLINAAGTQVVFDSPKALDGLTLWLDTYRAVAPAHKALVPEDCSSLFQQGRAAAVLLDIQRANTLLEDATNPLVRENLGTATLTNVPWVGSGNFVIWEHARESRERENAAVKLVSFLTSKDANLRWKQFCGHMPARSDALAEVYPSENPLHAAMELAARQGRTYYNIPLWRRIEYQLSQALGAVVKEANEAPSKSSSSILRAHLEPLARRLNLTLST